MASTPTPGEANLWPALAVFTVVYLVMSAAVAARADLLRPQLQYRRVDRRPARRHGGGGAKVRCRPRAPVATRRAVAICVPGDRRNDAADARAGRRHRAHLLHGRRAAAACRRSARHGRPLTSGSSFSSPSWWSACSSLSSTSARVGSRACSPSASTPPARSERRTTARASCCDHRGATVIGHRCRLVSAPAIGIQMKSILHHPATILAALGAVSGTLGSYRPRRQLRRRSRTRSLHGLRRTVVRPGYRLRPVALGRSFVAHRGDRRRGHVDRLGSRGQRRTAARPAVAGRHGRARRSQELRHRVRGGRHRCSADLGGCRCDDARSAPAFDARVSLSRPARCSDCCCRRPTNTTTPPSCCCPGRPRWRRRSG